MLNIGLKHHKNVISYTAPFEYEVFPVVRKSSNITRISQLQGKKFCHTGYGYQPLWSKVISEVNIFIVVKQNITVDHIISYIIIVPVIKLHASRPQKDFISISTGL
jgi:hypothetical protein